MPDPVHEPSDDRGVRIHRSGRDKAAAAGVAGHLQITTCRTLDDALAALE